MSLIRRTVRHAHGQKRDDRGNQIESRMKRFGKHAEAPRAPDQKRLQAQQHGGGSNAQQGRPLLLLNRLVQISWNRHRLRLPQTQAWRADRALVPSMVSCGVLRVGAELWLSQWCSSV